MIAAVKAVAIKAVALVKNPMELKATVASVASMKVSLTTLITSKPSVIAVVKAVAKAVIKKTAAMMKL